MVTTWTTDCTQLDHFILAFRSSRVDKLSSCPSGWVWRSMDTKINI